MTGLLAAFVGGTWLLQQCAELPGAPARGALLAAGVLAGLAGWRLRAAARARWPRRLAYAALLAAFAALGFGSAAWRAEMRLVDQLDPAEEGHDLVVTGLVASLPAAIEGGVRFEFELEHVATGSPVPTRVSLAWHAPAMPVLPGQRWRLAVRLRRPHGTLNPGGFDTEAWMFGQNLRASGAVRSGRDVPVPELLDALVIRPDLLVDRARDRLRAAMFAQLTGRTQAGVLVALVLGDQRAISAEQWALFNRTGISHLVSISGLHVTMIAGLGAALVALLWRRSAWALQRATVPVAAGTAAVVVALGYCLIAGWGVPAQRTFLMIATMAAMTALRGQAAAPLTLALAAAAVCVLDPWAVSAAGFWLSFGAVAAIFLVLHGDLGVGGPGGWRSLLLDALRGQAAVTMALMPLGIALFQQMSLVAPLANAVAIPTVSYVVTPLALCGGAMALLPGVASTVGMPLLWAADAVFGILAGLLRMLDTLPGASIALPAPPPALLAVSVCGVLWCLAPGIPARWAGLLWLAPLFAWQPQRPAAGELWVTALDVGQGMALVVESADAAVLFDTGPRYSAQADAGTRVVLPFLRQRGLRRLDAIIVSHLDIDHSGGLRAVHQAMGAGPLLTSIAPSHPLLAGIASERCEAGQRWRHGALLLEVLQPVAGDYLLKRTTNARSCVVRASVGALRVLLTGDVPARQEAEMVLRDASGSEDLRAALLVAPHHGSHTSSTDALIEAVAPRWVAIQVGYHSRFGHPHEAVVERYRAHGVEVLRTDHLGAIQWRLAADGGGWIERWRIDHRRYWHDQPGGRAVLAGGTGPNGGGTLIAPAPAGAPDDGNAIYGTPAAPDAEPEVGQDAGPDVGQ